MSVNTHSFVEWKEQFVSQERGKRVVHYFLKDSEGETIRAIIGTERSIRHMFYVVAEEFVQVYGAESSIHTGFKWRSRREVVDWLTSMLSKQNIQESSEHDAAQALISLDCSIKGIRVQQNQLHVDMGYLVNDQNSDIVWSGVAWTCGKQLKHYPAFCRNETSIPIKSFVFVMAKGHHHYLAYLEDMYEDRRGYKKVKVRWFHHTQEVKGVIPLRDHHPKEVFITPYVQVISAECVDGPATVLTREHYEKSEPSFPHALRERIHMCYKQFRRNQVKPFDLSKLRGYYAQSIFSFYPSQFSWHESGCRGLSGEEDVFSPGDNIKVGSKRTRKGKICEQLLRDYTHVCREHGLAYVVNEKIELLCQDSGIRGCWFRCTVLQVSRKQIKVQYDDMHEEDGCRNLEEWVPAFRLAVPDKLGMRYPGRSTIRPSPTPLKDQKGLVLKVGVAVDAWWSDGWWEGVVSGVDEFGDDTLQIYFPGENLFLNIHKRDLRISMDWVGDQWIEIAAKPDIFSTISAVFSSDTKVSISSTIAKDGMSDGFAMPPPEVPMDTKLDIIEEQLEIAAVVDSGDQPGNNHWVNDKNSTLLEERVIDDSDEKMKEDAHDNEDSDDNNNGLKLDTVLKAREQDGKAIV